MSEKIYIIEQIFCRREITIEKYSFDIEKFFSLLDAFKEDSFDVDGELSEEVSNKVVELFGTETWNLEQLLYSMLVGCVDDLTFEERVQHIKNGEYCVELEESMICCRIFS